jgi:hypothetical protein
MPFECEVGLGLKYCAATTKASLHMKCYPMEVCSTIDTHTPYHIHNRLLNFQEHKDYKNSSQCCIRGSSI